MAVNKEYILGSDSDELERLHFQHKVWSKEAFELWDRCGLSLGNSILDFGCGPGFTTFDLATIAGSDGSVLGIDKTSNYVEYAKNQALTRSLNNLNFQHVHFDNMNLQDNTFDAIYSRWVLSWVNNVDEIVTRAAKAIRPGGQFIFQEYLNWSTLAVYPQRPEVNKVIAACRESWVQMDSEINIGPLLPDMLSKLNFTIIHQKPLPKMGRSKSMVWQWPGTFLKIYSLKLIEYGLLTHADREAFLKVWTELEADENAFLVGPLMMEMVARKS